MDGFVYVTDGHLFESDPKDPEAEMIYELGDFHDGPSCMICKQTWCRNCKPNIYTEKCAGRDEPTLDGMEYRQPMIKGVVGRRIYDADIPSIS